MSLPWKLLPGHWKSNRVSAYGWYDRAIALMELGRFEEAVASYDRVLAITRNMPTHIMTRVTGAHELGRDEDALSAFEQATSIDPKFILAFYDQGLALARLTRNRTRLRPLTGHSRLTSSYSRHISRKAWCLKP